MHDERRFVLSPLERFLKLLSPKTPAVLQQLLDQRLVNDDAIRLRAVPDGGLDPKRQTKFTLRHPRRDAQTQVKVGTTAHPCAAGASGMAVASPSTRALRSTFSPIVPNPLTARRYRISPGGRLTSIGRFNSRRADENLKEVGRLVARCRVVESSSRPQACMRVSDCN